MELIPVTVFWVGRGLGAIKLGYNPCQPGGCLKLTVDVVNRLEPECWHGSLIRRTRRFFPRCGQSHRLYALPWLTDGWPGCRLSPPCFAGQIKNVVSDSLKLRSVIRLFQTRGPAAWKAVCVACVFIRSIPGADISKRSRQRRLQSRVSAQLCRSVWLQPVAVAAACTFEVRRLACHPLSKFRRYSKQREKRRFSYQISVLFSTLTFPSKF